MVIGGLSLLAVGLEFNEPLAKKIVEFDNAFLDPALKTLEAILSIDDLGFQGGEATVNSDGALLPLCGDYRQQFGQSLRREHVFPNRRQDQIIQEGYPDRVSTTGCRSLLRTAGAGVIGIDAPCAGGSGPLRHSSVAMGAPGKSGQKDRSGDHARGRDLGIIGHQANLDAIEQVLVDNGRRCDLNDFRGGLEFAGPGRADVVSPAADIDGVGQDMVRGTDAEGSAGLGPVAMAIEPFDQLLDAERRGAGFGVALRIQVEA